MHLKLWKDRTFRALSPIAPSAQSLWLHLLTGPATTAVPGIIPADLVEVNQGLGWPDKDLAFHLDEILAAGMAKADLAAPFIWLPKAITLNLPQSPNVIKSWRWVLSELPESLLREPACLALWTAVQEMGPGWSKAFRDIKPTWLDLSRRGTRTAAKETPAMQVHQALSHGIGKAMLHPGAGTGSEAGAGDRPSATIEVNRAEQVADGVPSLGPDFDLPEPPGKAPDGVKQDRSSLESAQLYVLHLQCSLKDQGCSAKLQAASFQLKPLGCFVDSGDPVLEAPAAARALLKSMVKGAVIYKEQKR